MSLEQRITQLTDAVNQLIQLIPVIESQKLPVQQLPIVEQVAPVAQPVILPTPVTTPVTTMPPPPVFMAPAPVAPVVSVPFTDGKGLIDYVMKAYSTLGPEKGAGIGSVLSTLGYRNINDVKPEHYAQLFAGIEGLK